MPLTDAQMDVMAAKQSPLSDDQMDSLAKTSSQASDSKSWLDKSILGYTPRGVIKSAASQLPTVGMIAGGAAATPANLMFGGMPVGTVAGAGAGYAGGKSLENTIDGYLDGSNAVSGTSLKGIGDQLSNVPGDVATGASYEMGGRLFGKGLSAAADTKAGQFLTSSVPKWAAQKVGKIFAAVPEDTTARYLENPAAINNALPREHINDQILDLKNNAQDQLDKAQEELANAKGDASDKKQAYKEALKNTNLTSMVGNVNDAIGNLKNQVIKGSSDAYDILGDSSGKVQTQPLVKLIQDHIDDLHVNGTPKSPSAAQAISELQAYQQNIAQMGTKKIPGPNGTWSIDNSLTMPEAKQVLQGLDKTISWKRPMGSFAPETDQALGNLRTAIDQDVKSQVPEYASRMSDVSRQSRLLGAASDTFGTPEKAISNLNNIDSQKGSAVHLPIIEALGKETGQDLSTPVNDFVAKQKILSTPSLFEKLINETPEVKRVSSAQNALDAAKERTQLFNGVTSDSVTSKTKALNGANQYGAQAKFGPIDEAHGTDLQKQIQARNDADQFAKEGTHGSRMAVIGGTLGGAIGHAVGGTEGAVLGASVGAQGGGVLDKYGGQIFKSGLNKAASAANAIRATGTALKSSPALAGQGVTSMIPTAPSFPQAASNQQPQAPTKPVDPKGPDKWAGDGFQNLKGHVDDDTRKMFDDNKGAMLVDPKMKQLLITASNFKPGSKPLDDIVKHLKNRLGEK